MGETLLAAAFAYPRNCAFYPPMPHLCLTRDLSQSQNVVLQLSPSLPITESTVFQASIIWDNFFCDSEFHAYAIIRQTLMKSIPHIV